MSKLYIIGNGFDLHHGLATKYTNFQSHLKTHHIQLLDSLNQYYILENDHSLWSKFEENLANLDKDSLLDFLMEYFDDTSDRGRNAMGIETETYLDLLTNGLRREFSDFILKAEAKGIDRSKLIQIDIDAKFICFNYTNTLEKYYLIPNDNIFYIHGIAREKEGITLGHSTDPELFNEEKPEPIPPEEASKELLEQWYEYMSDQHNPIYDDCVSTVNRYFLSSFKDTKNIIEENSLYFDDLSDIKEVFIYGHSMSDVDMPYIEKIASTVKSNCCWFISYYDQNEKEDIQYPLEHLNISSEFYQLIKLTDLQNLSTTD